MPFSTDPGLKEIIYNCKKHDEIREAFKYIYNIDISWKKYKDILNYK